MATINYRGRTVEIRFVDPSVESGGDGLLPSSAFKVLPPPSNLENSTLYVLRRGVEHEWAISGGPSNSIVGGFFMIFGCPKPEDEIYTNLESVVPEISTWGVEASSEATLVEDDDRSYINFSGNRQSLHLFRLVLLRRNHLHSLGERLRVVGLNNRVFIERACFGIWEYDQDAQGSRRVGGGNYIGANSTNVSRVLIKNSAGVSILDSIFQGASHFTSLDGSSFWGCLTIQDSKSILLERNKFYANSQNTINESLLTGPCSSLYIRNVSYSRIIDCDFYLNLVQAYGDHFSLPGGIEINGTGRSIINSVYMRQSNLRIRYVGNKPNAMGDPITNVRDEFGIKLIDLDVVDVDYCYIKKHRLYYPPNGSFIENPWVPTFENKDSGFLYSTSDSLRDPSNSKQVPPSQIQRIVFKGPRRVSGLTTSTNHSGISFSLGYQGNIPQIGELTSLNPLGLSFRVLSKIPEESRPLHLLGFRDNLGEGGISISDTTYFEIDKVNSLVHRNTPLVFVSNANLFINTLSRPYGWEGESIFEIERGGQLFVDNCINNIEGEGGNIYGIINSLESDLDPSSFYVHRGHGGQWIARNNYYRVQTDITNYREESGSEQSLRFSTLEETSKIFTLPPRFLKGFRLDPYNTGLHHLNIFFSLNTETEDPWNLLNLWVEVPGDPLNPEYRFLNISSGWFERDWDSTWVGSINYGYKYIMPLQVNSIDGIYVNLEYKGSTSVELYLDPIFILNEES